MSASKVVVQRMRLGTKAQDLEKLLLRKWTSEHHSEDPSLKRESPHGLTQHMCSSVGTELLLLRVHRV